MTASWESCGLRLSRFVAALGVEVPRDADAQEVERQHGAGEQAHRDRAGVRADDGGDDEDGQHGVAEVPQQELRVHDAEQREKEDQDGKLETDAQAENDREKKPRVLVDGDDGMKVGPEGADQGLERDGQQPVIAHKCANQKERHRRQHERPDIFLLVLIHAGRDEEPYLVQNEWRRQDRASEERGLDVEVDRVCGVRVVEALVDIGERLLDDVVQLDMKGPGYGKAPGEEVEAVQDAFAQLFQVLHQAHAGKIGAVADGFARVVDGIEISHAGSLVLTPRHGLRCGWPAESLQPAATHTSTHDAELEPETLHG